MHFVCSKCKGMMEGTVDSINKSCDEVESNRCDGVVVVASASQSVDLGFIP